MREILKTISLICTIVTLGHVASIELPLATVKSSDLQKAFVFSEGHGSISDNEAQEIAKKIAGDSGVNLLKNHPGDLARLISILSPNTKKIDSGIKAAEEGKNKINTGKGKYDTGLSIATSNAISLIGKEPLDSAEVLKYGLKIGNITSTSRSQNNVSEFAQLESIKVSRASFPEMMCKEWQKTGFLDELFGKDQMSNYESVMKLLKSNLSPISGIALNIAISSGALKPIAYKQDGRDKSLDKPELNYIDDHNKSWEYSNELVNHCLKSFDMLKVLLENPVERENLSRLVLFILKDDKNREIFQNRFNKYSEKSVYIPMFGEKKGLDSLFHFKDKNGKQSLLNWKKFVEKIGGTEDSQNSNQSKEENSNLDSDASTTDDNSSEISCISEDFYSKAAIDKLKTSINSGVEKLKSFLSNQNVNEKGSSENASPQKDPLIKITTELKAFLPAIRDSISNFKEELDRKNNLMRLLGLFRATNSRGIDGNITGILKEVSRGTIQNEAILVLKRMSEYKLNGTSLISLLFSEGALNEDQKSKLTDLLKNKDSVASLIQGNRNNDKALLDALLSIIFYRGNIALGYSLSKEEYIFPGIDDGKYSISMEKTLGLGPRNLNLKMLKKLADENLLPSFNLAIEILRGKLLLPSGKEASESESEVSHSDSRVSTSASKSELILSSGGILDQVSDKLDQLLKLEITASDRDNGIIKEAIKLFEDALSDLENPDKASSVDLSDASDAQSNGSQDLAGNLNESDSLIDRITRAVYAYKDALLKTVNLINFKPSELIGETIEAIQIFVSFAKENVITPAGSILLLPIKNTIAKVFE